MIAYPLANLLPEHHEVCAHCQGRGLIIANAVVARQFKQARLRMHVKECDVARLMGYKLSYISHLEAGRDRWNPHLIEAYWDALTKLAEEREGRG